MAAKRRTAGNRFLNVWLNIQFDESNEVIFCASGVNKIEARLSGLIQQIAASSLAVNAMQISVMKLKPPAVTERFKIWFLMRGAFPVLSIWLQIYRLLRPTPT
jgi:hypothetical protein